MGNGHAWEARSQPESLSKAPFCPAGQGRPSPIPQQFLLQRMYLGLFHLIGEPQRCSHPNRLRGGRGQCVGSGPLLVTWGLRKAQRSTGTGLTASELERTVPVECSVGLGEPW